jgi:hypothetical protein
MTNGTIDRAILPVCFSAGGTLYIIFQHENGNDQEMMFQKKSASATDGSSRRSATKSDRMPVMCKNQENFCQHLMVDF